MLKMKKVIVIIPARQGSKSIKDKNIKKINGKPMLEYSIEYAKRSKIVNQIVVSTDSKKYLDKIKKYKLDFSVLRKKKLSGDLVKDFPVIKDALKRSEYYFKKRFDFIILLRPTSPFREKNLIERSLKILLSKRNATSVRAMFRTKQHPYRQWKYDSKKVFVRSIIPSVHEPFNLPRQKLPNYFFQTGEIETIKRSTIMSGSISGNFILPILIKKQSIDVDDLSDLKIKKKIFKSK